MFPHTHDLINFIRKRRLVDPQLVDAAEHELLRHERSEAVKEAPAPREVTGVEPITEVTPEPDVSDGDGDGDEG